MSIDIDNLKSLVKEWADLQEDKLRIYLFGSHVAGNVNSGSDIDIGIECIDDYSANEVYAAVIETCVSLEEFLEDHIREKIHISKINSQNDPKLEKGYIVLV